MNPLKVGVIAAFTLTLCGCTGAQTSFYALQPSPRSSAPLTYAGTPFRVDAVHIPASLDRPELLETLPDNQLAVRDNEHWAGPLGDLFRQTLTQDLAAQLGADKIIFPNAPKPAGAGGLVVDILAIEPEGLNLAMDVSWTLLPGPSSTPSGMESLPRHGTLHLSTPGAAIGPKAYVSEISALTSKLAGEIAQQIASGIDN